MKSYRNYLPILNNGEFRCFLEIFCHDETWLLGIKKLTNFQEKWRPSFLSFPCCDILFFIIVNYRENKDDTSSCTVPDSLLIPRSEQLIPPNESLKWLKVKWFLTAVKWSCQTLIRYTLRRLKSSHLKDYSRIHRFLLNMTMPTALLTNA